jgi:hypothetical protein
MKLTQIVCAGLLPFWLSLAQPAADPAQVCSVPPNFSPNLELDANTNTVLSGRTDYPRLQEVKVLVHRPNPFKYNYRTTYTAKVLESEASHSRGVGREGGSRGGRQSARGQKG